MEDDADPFFTTPHFNGHRSVLLRASRIGELTADELAEVVYDAWLARAGVAREEGLARRARARRLSRAPMRRGRSR